MQAKLDWEKDPQSHGPWIRSFDLDNTAVCLVNAIGYDVLHFAEAFPAYSRGIKKLALNPAYLLFKSRYLLAQLCEFESLKE